jgi:hypothetical protein
MSLIEWLSKKRLHLVNRKSAFPISEAKSNDLPMLFATIPAITLLTSDRR